MWDFAVKRCTQTVATRCGKAAMLCIKGGVVTDAEQLKN